MKRSDLFVSALLVPLDYSMLIAAGSVAYFLRFQAFADIRPVIFEIPFSSYLFTVALISIFFIFIFALSGLYSLNLSKIKNEIQRVITSSSSAMMLVIVFIFFIRELFSSRFIVLAAWILSIVFVLVGRAFLRGLKVQFFKSGIGVHSLALIGPIERCERFQADIMSHPSLGYRIQLIGEQLSDKLKQEILSHRAKNILDEVVLLSSTIPNDQFQDIWHFTSEHHIIFRYSADRMQSHRLEIGTLAGVPMIEIKRTSLEGWGRIVKRVFDMIASTFLILIFTPLMTLVALAIRLESRGNPLYISERVGQFGKHFRFFKFRSMYIQYCTGARYDSHGAAEQYELDLAKTKSERKGPVFKVLADPRRTHFGRIIERWSIDELPQLFNVLFGTMSLVGPRPHMPLQVAQYERWHKTLFAIKPGMTGMAQIEGRSDLDFEDEARLDIFYIEHWSLTLDLIILLKTPWVVATRKSRV